MQRLIHVENLNISNRERKIKRTIMWVTVATLAWVIPLTHDYTLRVVYEQTTPLSSSREKKGPENAGDTLPAGTDRVSGGVPTGHDEKIAIIKQAAQKYGIDWKIIFAICKKESNCDSSATGDGGTSFGAYQIHRPAHPDVSVEHARDFAWATDFTAKRLKAHAWMGEDEMVRSHNGLVADHRNDYYVRDVKSIIAKI